jgi:hypothetical protein
MIRALLIFLVLPLTLTACDTTVSAERAYEECSERARLAERPRGSVGLGVGSGGRAVSSFDVTVTGDFLAGRDPYVVYDQCFRRLTGAGPTRPLIL